MTPAAGVIGSACVVLAFVGGCSPAGPQSPDRAAEVDGVRLEATLSEAQGLRVEYTVTNDGDVPVTVLDRMPGEGSFSSAYVVDDERVTVDAYADGVVELSKRSYATPDDVTLESPWELQGTRLAPGDSVSGVGVTPFPLQVVGIGFDIEPVGLDEVPADAERWRFCIEVGEAGDVEVEATDDGLPAVWVNNPMDGEILCTDTQQLPEGWR
ncbi:hypothetical protein [uncultured Cellulomonas sp.]|uniref:hypothetical protein n=1 Tax=uncultured Cellulomonas sp. TaxID=189682 RepID=UPI0028E8C4E7|nr:hypothetical protein [uncultured Cellulomonas sp.]